jgi:PKD repeat protein
LGDTWKLVGQMWENTGLSMPGARTGGALAFDGLPADFYVVLWGGVNAGVYTGQSWEFTGTAWTLLSNGVPPAALTGATLVNVPNNDYVVLFGGQVSGGATNSTWLFRGGSWTLLTLSTAPSPRYNAAAAYDAVLGGVVLFGGYAGGTKYLNDTWEFLGAPIGHWVNVTSGLSPSARAQAGVAFDDNPAISDTVLFGGYNGMTYLNDTWEFNSTAVAWTQVMPLAAPAPRADPMMTYDGPDGYIVMFGGINGTSNHVYNDTWDFRGQSAIGWFNLTKSAGPSGRFGSRAAFNPYNGYVVMFGGRNITTPFNDTWEFLAGNWTLFSPPVSPAARSDAAFSFDRGDHYIVQFGGTGAGPTTLDDTWLWVGFNAQVTAFPNPTDVGILVSFGASAVAGIKPYTYDWAFGDGMSSGPTTNPAVNHTYTTAGVYTASVVVTDSRTVPGPDETMTNETVVVNPALSVVAVANTTSDLPGRSIAFNSTSFGGTGPYAFSWTFGDGAKATGENVTHSYSTNRTFNATVVVNDSVGGSANYTLTITITPVLAATVCARNVESAACASSTSTDVGVPVYFNGTPIGGTGPYHYLWQFGDGTNATVNDTTHAYSAVGTYHVKFWVNDSASHSFNTTLTVTVVPAPSVVVDVLPLTTGVGDVVTFNSTVSHGTPSFTYLWTFGDGDTASTANASHAYTATGVYSVTFVATDHVGQTATGTASVTVAAAPMVSSSAAPSPSEVGVAVVFTATVTGGASPVSLAWVFGDGGKATGANPSHTYATAGTFTADVWANDSLGRSAESSVSVTVAAAITSAAIASPSATDVGVPVTFTGASSGGVGAATYAWSFGDGTGGTGASAQHTYTADGTYHVTLWANDSLGASGMSTTTVVVAADPTISGFTVSPTSVTSGSAVTFSAVLGGGTGPYSYAYSGLPAGCATVDQASLTCSPSATGTYSVVLTVTDAAGKTASSTVTLTVTSTPSTFLGLPATEGYLLLLLVLVIIGVLVAWALLRRGRDSSGTTSTETTTSTTTTPEGTSSETTAKSETDTTTPPEDDASN